MLMQTVTRLNGQDDSAHLSCGNSYVPAAHYACMGARTRYVATSSQRGERCPMNGILNYGHGRPRKGARGKSPQALELCLLRAQGTSHDDTAPGSLAQRFGLQKAKH